MLKGSQGPLPPQRERGAGAEGSFCSGASSRAVSPSACSSRISRILLNGNGDVEGERERGNAISEGSAMLAAQRILALSTESLDMMRNVMGRQRQLGPCRCHRFLFKIRHEIQAFHIKRIGMV